MKMETRSRALDKLYKRRDRIEMPDLQREEVWTDNKKRLLIYTVLRGWHLPKFYFRKTEDGGFECVDGQVFVYRGDSTSAEVGAEFFLNSHAEAY